MKRKSREVNLVYYDPTVLTDIIDNASTSELTWQEMIENIELGHEELKALLRLTENTDLSMREFICLYLYYWEELSEPDISEKLSISQPTVFRTLKSAKKKLKPKLTEIVNRNA